MHGGNDASEPARQRRVARNEAFFREANEVVEREAAQRVSGTPAFICECSSVGCMERVRLSREDYERARERGDWFIVVPGHEDPSVEEVVERNAIFFIVQKMGLAGAVARSEDPR